MRADANLINPTCWFEDVPEQPVYAELSQSVPLPTRLDALIVYNPPTISEWLVFAGVLAFGGYALSKLCEPEQQSRRCSGCGRTSHTAATCPYIGERKHFPKMEKAGRCECCGKRASYTEDHHYGGRADNTKRKEMCFDCHFYCGHGGDWTNFPINPSYCRL